MAWKHRVMGRRVDPRERKPFVREKMSRLAFRLGGRGGCSIDCNQSCSCTCRGHQAGIGGSAVVDTLLPRRKEQSPVNPSGLWP